MFINKEGEHMEFVFLIIGSLIIAIVVDIFEDIIVGYSIFFNKVCTTAEILWFEQCAGYHCCYDVAIIKMQGDIPQKFIVNRSGKDKEGDIIEIATNGDMAVRTRWCWKKDISIPQMMLYGALLLGMIYYVMLHIDQVTITAVVIGLAEVVFVIFIYPFLYSYKIKACKSDLGWH